MGKGHEKVPILKKRLCYRENMTAMIALPHLYRKWVMEKILLYLISGSGLGQMTLQENRGGTNRR